MSVVCRRGGAVLEAVITAAMRRRSTRRQPLVGLVLALAAMQPGCSAAPNEQPQKGPADVAATVAQPIVCDRFEIVQSLSGGTLTVSLDTDLPDYTGVMVSVSRSYKVKGNTKDDYPLNYLEEKGTIERWRQPRQVSVAHESFKKALEERKRTTSKAGIGFELGPVFPDVQVSFTVPIFQDNPAFGERNKNLTGRAVVVEPHGRMVRAEVHIPHPLTRKAADSEWAIPPRWASVTLFAARPAQASHLASMKISKTSCFVAGSYR